ncbi:hypothetical protein [Labedaea rhizosphaerae]|uniref:Uncharacterized protein n=1 Tax=Labedaea rhizosphaerae TaxID=598644 RepID=A0A4R6SBH5_LABRH|nr:hypothetical protein [Labedaea rhizosphaerae]TDP96225.1 hypothetical protein EV186_104207 [Labedaea rhizosphaerae]
MTAQVTYSLRTKAKAEYTQLTVHQSALVLYLNSADVVITAAPDDDGARLLLDFCVELAREASILADELDPKYTPQGRHAKPRDEGQPYDY